MVRVKTMKYFKDSKKYFTPLRSSFKLAAANKITFLLEETFNFLQLKVHKVITRRYRLISKILIALS